MSGERSSFLKHPDGEIRVAWNWHPEDSGDDRVDEVVARVTKIGPDLCFLEIPASSEGDGRLSIIVTFNPQEYEIIPTFDGPVDDSPAGRLCAARQNLVDLLRSFSD